MKKWLLRAALAVGILCFSAIIWFAGPLIGFGETYPLEGFWIRFFIIFTVVMIVAGYYGIKWYLRRRAAKRLEAELLKTEENVGDAPVLGERMRSALEILKESKGGVNYLYDLPWYIIIGPPGAGKTTALVNSGLKFPLARDGAAASVAGTGGTRYCDWWFAEDAVLIDTAGRYTTQDSDAKADKKSWQSFLEILKSNRTKQPINGVIVAISLEDIMTDSEEALAAHSNAIRDRLLEIHNTLKIDFPVYALFTKADLIAGFSEYFGSFTESRRRKVWGATFQTEDRKKNMSADVPGEFDALVMRLTEEVTDRLQEEPDPIARIAIFGFPAQFAMLRDRVNSFLNGIFEPTRYKVNANLRGFYFSSGTQEGTPIDQVLGAMNRSFGAAHGVMSAKGRSYFLHDLLTKVIFAESGWVSFDRAAVRRAAVIRYASIAAICAVTTGLIGMWGVSFAKNRALIRAADTSVDAYRNRATPELEATTITDPDLLKVTDLLNMLRSMPAGYEARETDPAFTEGMGLGQRERLVSATSTTYQQALERSFRSRLILRLEQQLEQMVRDNDLLGVYEVLKIYMMVGAEAPTVDENYIIDWMRRDWEANTYPGPTNAAARAQLEQHLVALLDLDDAKPPTYLLNKSLIDNAQLALAGINIADQAYSLIKQQASAADIPDFFVADAAGPTTIRVLETTDGSDISELKVPMLYTYRGFHEYFMPRLSDIAEGLLNEQWVMGEQGKAARIEEQFGRLGPQLLRIYSDEFVVAWNSVIDRLKLKPMAADKPAYEALSLVSAPSSPLRAFFEALKRETQLTRDDAPASGEGVIADVQGEGGKVAEQATNVILDRWRSRTGGLQRIGIDLVMSKLQDRAGDVFGTGGGGGGNDAQLPGATVEAQFRQYNEIVEGEPPSRPIDVLVENYAEIYKNLSIAAASPSQADVATASLPPLLANLRRTATQMPPNLKRMIEASVNEFEGEAANTSLAQLNKMLNSEVTRQCELVVANRYPFARQSSRDVPMQEFARLFAPNGIIDRFFQQNLAPLSDMSAEQWVWKEDSRLGRALSASTLREFQRAAEIRDAFFPLGSPMPSVNANISQQSLHGEAEGALFMVNGRGLKTQQDGNATLDVAWPGSGGSGSVSVQLFPEIPGYEPAIVIEGPWSFMRLLDKGQAKLKGDVVQVQFNIGGRYVSYNIRVDAVRNPFFLRALNDFKCPTGL